MEDHQEQLTDSFQDLNLQEDHQSEENQPINKSWPRPIEEVEEIVGYKFKDPSLLNQALTHYSYHQEENCESYERLEYMGDSVLNLLIAKEHYLLYPDLSPGKLTRLRSVNVDTEKLARVAIKHSLHKYLLHRKPLLNKQIEDFENAIAGYPLHSSGLIDAPKVLADVVESIIGAIYIDCDFSMDITWQVVKNLLQPIITPTSLQIHPVTKVHEICQKNGLQVKFVDSWNQTGEFEVFVNDEFVGRGQYHAKRCIAINRAANNAYKQIVRMLTVEERIDDDNGSMLSEVIEPQRHLCVPCLCLAERTPNSTE